MMNWRELMTLVQSWLKPDGRFFPAYLHPPYRRLSLRPRGPRRLDRAAFLHRRGNAQPSSDPAICRPARGSKRNGAGAARIISAPRSTGWRIFDLPPRGDRRHPPPGLRQRYELMDAALALVLPRKPQACSAMPAAANGASAITGCGWGRPRAPDAAQRVVHCCRAGAVTRGQPMTVGHHQVPTTEPGGTRFEK